MSELRISEQEVLSGGSFAPQDHMGGFIEELDRLWVPGYAEQTNGSHEAQLVDMLEGFARRFRNVFAARVYKDSTDDALEFSVTAFTVEYAGMQCSYAGEVNLGPLSAGATRYIWADLSAAPAVTIGVGSAWPAVAHIKLVAIAAPASGHWKLQHVTDYCRSQAVTASSGAPQPLTLDFDYTDTGGQIMIGNMPAGAWAAEILFKPRVAFNGASPVASVGDAGDHERLMAETEIDLSQVVVFQTNPMHKYASETPLYLYFDWGGSTAGEGTVIVRPIATTGGVSPTLVKEFTKDSVSPLLMGYAASGSRAIRASVKFDPAFDGASPQLSMGDVSNHERLLSAAEADPAVAGLYSSTPLYRFPGLTPVYLYFDWGGSTAGEGVATLEMVP